MTNYNSLSRRLFNLLEKSPRRLIPKWSKLLALDSIAYDHSLECYRVRDTVVQLRSEILNG